uniref:Matrix metalloproteinase-14 n=1 Tax=Propithecus coquereli TaxID=379532 RepID=A0A2K6FE68_PROCO
MKCLAILVLLCLPVCWAYTLKRAAKEEDTNMDLVQKYLENYYDLAKDVKKSVRRRDSGSVVKKIQEMQKFLGLEVTGKLDSDTLEVIRKPRCGVPDVGHFTTFPGTPKWRKTHLTYRIVNYTPDLPRDAVDSAIEKALKVWEEVTPLTFSRMYEGEADIMVSFAVGGNQFWAVRGSEVQAGYPRSIHTLGFPPTIRKIDAALSDKEKKKTYFFVEDKYWRFDENSQSMEQGFPRLIADDFPGVEPKVDAVFQAFGFFYFFSGSSQFEFDPNARMVTHISKSNSWLQC